MSTIAVGSTLNIQFQFELEGVLTDPDTLTGEIFLYDTVADAFPGTPTSTFTATQVSTGVYEYDWTPGVAGTYKLRLNGNYVAAQTDIEHLKYFLIGDTAASNTLDSSYCITMLGELEPLYVDPEYILQFYSDADIIEVTEIIHRKSIALEEHIGCDPVDALTTLQHDWIVAATMCELSRIYGLSNGGLTGFVSASSFKLGDLEVDKGSSSGRLASGSYDVGNAGSWCELAFELKQQLNSYKDKMRPVVPGAIYEGVVPSRNINDTPST